MTAIRPQILAESAAGGWDGSQKVGGQSSRGRGILIECEDGTLYLAGAGIRLSLRRFHDEGVPYSPIVEERHVNYDLVWEGTLSYDALSPAAASAAAMNPITLSSPHPTAAL